ncbi:MAG TPA: C40 family peptidase [Gaiellaceae bacterium]|nr:C40 family peptidase [Gaiellaceae bacterium]
MRRLAFLLLLALACPAAASATPSQGASWAKAQIRQAVAAGLMAPAGAAFQPRAPLTERALQQIVDGLNARLTPQAPPPTTTTVTVPLPTTTTTTTTTTPGSVVLPGTTTAPTTTVPTTSWTTTTVTQTVPAPAPPWPLFSYKAQAPAATVTLQQFDHVLVDALGLSDAAAKVLGALRSAGLNPPARAGTETIARLVGLRLNHPAAEDDLELLPTQPITRAEAAYSAARALDFDRGAHDWVEQAAAAFQLPALSDWQRRILTTAVSYVGFPYVWGGTSPGPETPAGVPAVGGFDCSGFVWRVYKLTSYPNEGRLASTLAGRTTYQMAAESTRTMKIAKVQNLKPGDVLLFGNGPASPSSQVDHAAIYLGNDWLVQSSGNGVTIAPFDGWYRSSFVFARRPLREAGLDR